MPKARSAAADQFPTSVRLPKELKSLLQKEAVDKQRSVNWVIVEILQQWRAFMTKKKKAPKAE